MEKCKELYYADPPYSNLVWAMLGRVAVAAHAFPPTHPPEGEGKWKSESPNTFPRRVQRVLSPRSLVALEPSLWEREGL